jgi:hypothetical protein
MPKEFVENIRGSLSGASSFSGPTNVKDAETPEKVSHDKMFGGEGFFILSIIECIFNDAYLCIKCDLNF